MVVFSFKILNRTLDKWFSFPTKEILESSEAVSTRLNEIMRHKTETDAAWLASLPVVARALGARATGETILPDRLEATVRRVGAEYVAIVGEGSTEPVWEVRGTALFKGPVAWKSPSATDEGLTSGIAQDIVWASAPVMDGERRVGRLIVGWPIPRDILDRQQHMATAMVLQRTDIEQRHLAACQQRMAHRFRRQALQPHPRPHQWPRQSMGQMSTRVSPLTTW
jgi:nitrogen fixation/metabolism regulation signal transduction histidine kinase